MKFQLTTVDTVLSKFDRDVRDENIDKDSLIEWIGDALSFLSYSGGLEEAVVFANVENHKVSLPSGFKYILDVAKNNSPVPLCPDDIYKEKCNCQGPRKEEADHEEETQIVEVTEYVDCEDCGCQDCGCEDRIYTSNGYTEFLLPHFSKSSLVIPKAFMNLYWSSNSWYGSNLYRNNFEPVKLARSSFFKSIVCPQNSGIYKSCRHEYSVGNGYLTFSFPQGQVAISYLRTPIDPETGYPLIPDDISYITAIVYYIKWKLAESYSWSGREGFTNEADRAEARWLRYVSQAKIKNKKLTTRDDWDSLLESINSRNLYKRL